MSPLLLLAACSPTATPDVAIADPAAPGPWQVGHRRSELSVRGRTISVELWYPAEATMGPTPVQEAFLEGERRSTYATLLADAPTGCPSTMANAMANAPAADGGPWPAVISSHCMGCTRFSTFTVAERLASHGVVVAAPDHEGDTIFDTLAGTPLPLDTATLSLRRADVGATLDALLGGELASDLPIDAQRVGAVGHSFGSVTIGLLTQEDPRIRAAVGLAAPMENPLLPGVSMASITTPVLLVVAREDHSITEIGNQLIRANFERAAGPAALAEIDDAGHWSLSDLCGVIDGFMPGCGQDTRLDGSPFTYLAADTGRAATATLTTAFFVEHLGDGVDHLGSLHQDGITLTHRP